MFKMMVIAAVGKMVLSGIKLLVLHLEGQRVVIKSVLAPTLLWCKASDW